MTIAGANAAAHTSKRFFEKELTLLRTAMLCVEAIKAGHVGIFGSTGQILDGALKELQDLTVGALAEVRVKEEENVGPA